MFLLWNLASRGIGSLKLERVSKLLRERKWVERIDGDVSFVQIGEDVTAGSGKERRLDPTQLGQKLVESLFELFLNHFLSTK